jgi:deazaflavin-dependent oxidoreductase (nitroreductase family)
MDRQTPVTVPPSLRYRDGLYQLERFPRAGVVTSVRTKRTLTRPLRALHGLWFAVWMPRGVAALTTIGRKSGKPRTTFVRAYRDGDKAYLVSIGGEHALWLKNIRANPELTLRFRRDTLRGVARDPDSDAERQAAEDAFCGNTHPFDYVENMFHRKGLPTRAKILELHMAWLEGGKALIVEPATHRSQGNTPRQHPA